MRNTRALYTNRSAQRCSFGEVCAAGRGRTLRSGRNFSICLPTDFRSLRPSRATTEVDARLAGCLAFLEEVTVTPTAIFFACSAASMWTVLRLARPAGERTICVRRFPRRRDAGRRKPYGSVSPRRPADLRSRRGFGRSCLPPACTAASRVLAASRTRVLEGVLVVQVPLLGAEENTVHPGAEERVVLLHNLFRIAQTRKSLSNIQRKYIYMGGTGSSQITQACLPEEVRRGCHRPERGVPNAVLSEQENKYDSFSFFFMQQTALRSAPDAPACTHPELTKEGERRLRSAPWAWEQPVSSAGRKGGTAIHAKQRSSPARRTSRSW